MANDPRYHIYYYPDGNGHTSLLYGYATRRGVIALTTPANATEKTEPRHRAMAERKLNTLDKYPHVAIRIRKFLVSRKPVSCGCDKCNVTRVAKAIKIEFHKALTGNVRKRA